MISGLHQQAVVSIEEPEKGKRELMAQNDIGIDLGTTTIIIAQEGKGARSGARFSLPCTQAGEKAAPCVC